MENKVAKVACDGGLERTEGCVCYLFETKTLRCVCVVGGKVGKKQNKNKKVYFKCSR